MNKIKKLTLIESVLSNEDAKDILLSIFSSKINFHKIKNLSSQERFEKDDEIAKQKIALLRTEMEKLKEILAEAKSKNKSLVVTSEINISLSDNL